MPAYFSFEGVLIKCLISFCVYKHGFMALLMLFTGLLTMSTGQTMRIVPFLGTACINSGIGWVPVDSIATVMQRDTA